MASTNQSPFYQKAEVKFLSSQTDEERVKALEEMIRECPKHKSAEKMLAKLKTRYKKLKERMERVKKVQKSRGGKAGIKKEDMQAVIIGMTNSGKSSLINLLTNAKPEINPNRFTTNYPIVGMMSYAGTSIQLVEVPAIESEYYDKGIAHTADTIIVLITGIEQIKPIQEFLTKAYGKKIIVLNKSDTLSENEKRKIAATLQSKKHNFVIISTKAKENIEELKNKIFQSFDKIRIYTKEPWKKEKTEKPIILEPNSTVKDVAEKILKGFSEKVKETKIWGPSSKFAGQKIGLQHKLKDMDVVEFKTK
ncbi:GTPase CgtA [archaeon BMS3Abin17]|nr:GTPase CgtA [archaeon BMS3Abin17]HDZ61240.1 TGS domain-containing protein [Candidatus Pacearchaeota archaeon]